MARDKKINMVFLVKKSISFFIIVFILYGILNSIFLSKDDESISQAEGKIFFAEINIKKGALKQANEDLSKVEIVSTELMGRKRLWPSFRNRERKITAKLKSLRFAVAEYKNHFESILTKVFESLKFK